MSKQETAKDTHDYYNSGYIKIQLRNCTRGEHYTQKSCLKCDEGKYSFNPEKECKSCPKGAICPGGAVLLMKPDYWRPSEKSDVVYECPYPAACVGSKTAEDYLGSCEDGYYGHMCQSCAKDYSRTSNNRCVKCPDNVGNVVKLVFILLILIVICVIMVKQTLESAYEPQKLYSVYLKIFTNYIQLVFLTTQFNLKWPDYVLELFNVQLNTATIINQVFSPECFLRQSGATSEQAYYQKVIILAILPLILWAGAFIVWFTIAYRRKD